MPGGMCRAGGIIPEIQNPGLCSHTILRFIQLQSDAALYNIADCHLEDWY